MPVIYPSSKQVIQYTKSGLYSITMPEGYTSTVDVYLWGAGGGAGAGAGGAGGPGGFVKTTLDIKPNDILVVTIGSAGQPGVGTKGGLGGSGLMLRDVPVNHSYVGDYEYFGGRGGDALDDEDADIAAGGGGGGATAILLNGREMAVAGGGGGGGGQGDDGESGTAGVAGGGGSVGGIAYTSSSTTGGGNGIPGANSGGGGGAGHPGGASGGYAADDGAGGGGGIGGTNWVDASLSSVTTFGNGSGKTPGGISDLNYPGSGVGTPSSDGGIVLVFQKQLSANNNISSVWKKLTNAYVKVPATAGKTITQTFTTANANAAFTVPPGVTSLYISATGGGGGGGGADAQSGIVGYPGHTVSGNIYVTPGANLKINVGSGGIGGAGGSGYRGIGAPGGDGGAGFFPGGKGGNSGSTGWSGAGGGGGGATTVFLEDNILLVAAGGGGGGGGGCNSAGKPQVPHNNTKSQGASGLDHPSDGGGGGGGGGGYPLGGGGGDYASGDNGAPSGADGQDYAPGLPTGTQIYSSGSFAYTVPAGVTSLTIELVGGGGGGGYSNRNSPNSTDQFGGGGGGSGGYVKQVITVTPGQVLHGNVGVGGTGASSGNVLSQATQGTASDFAGYVAYGGGSGGNPSNTAIGTQYVTWTSYDRDDFDESDPTYIRVGSFGTVTLPVGQVPYSVVKKGAYTVFDTVAKRANDIFYNGYLGKFLWWVASVPFNVGQAGQFGSGGAGSTSKGGDGANGTQVPNTVVINPGVNPGDACGGTGGSSVFGLGGVGGIGNQNGANGRGYGSGGGGAGVAQLANVTTPSAYAGGNGAGGLVKVSYVPSSGFTFSTGNNGGGLAHVGGTGSVVIKYSLPIVVWKKIVGGWVKQGGVWKNLFTQKPLAPTPYVLPPPPRVPVVLKINTTVYNYNVVTALLSSNYVRGYSDITINVANTAVVGSIDETLPAFTLGKLVLGDTVTINNYGYIVGAGGDGGNNTGSSNGGAGGDALSINWPVTINNQGTIASGGGGGASQGTTFIPKLFPVGIPSGASYDATTNALTFSTPGIYSITIPQNVANIGYTVVGAGGGAGGFNGTPRISNAGSGKPGGYVTGRISVTAGKTFDIVVGSGGTGGSYNGNALVGGTTAGLGGSVGVTVSSSNVFVTGANVSANIAATTTNTKYTALGNQYGIWTSYPASSTSFTYTYTVNFPISTYYYIKGTCNATGNVKIDGNVALSMPAVGVDYSAVTYVTSGNHSVTLTAVGPSTPGSIAVLIAEAFAGGPGTTSGTPVLFSTTTPGSQSFLTPGRYTFTVPDYTTSLTITGAAGGGGGGGGWINELSPIEESEEYYGGGGGGSGGIINTTLAVTPGQVLEINVGSGGTAGLPGGLGSTTASAGGAGSSSNIKILGSTVISANGGGGGSVGALNTSTVGGAAGDPGGIAGGNGGWSATMVGVYSGGGGPTGSTGGSLGSLPANAGGYVKYSGSSVRIPSPQGCGLNLRNYWSTSSTSQTYQTPKDLVFISNTSNWDSGNLSALGITVTDVTRIATVPPNVQVTTDMDDYVGFGYYTITKSGTATISTWASGTYTSKITSYQPASGRQRFINVGTFALPIPGPNDLIVLAWRDNTGINNTVYNISYPGGLAGGAGGGGGSGAGAGGAGGGYFEAGADAPTSGVAGSNGSINLSWVSKPTYWTGNIGGAGGGGGAASAIIDTSTSTPIIDVVAGGGAGGGGDGFKSQAQLSSSYVHILHNIHSSGGRALDKRDLGGGGGGGAGGGYPLGGAGGATRTGDDGAYDGDSGDTYTFNTILGTSIVAGTVGGIVNNGGTGSNTNGGSGYVKLVLPATKIVPAPGAGGAGSLPGLPGYTLTHPNAIGSVVNAPTAATLTSAGQAGNVVYNSGTVLYSGPGGGLGQPGGAAGTAAGGATGRYIVGNTFVTWTTLGNIGGRSA